MTYSPSQDDRYLSLSRMVDEQIEREGSMSSFMVRAGLLREIIDRLNPHKELESELAATVGYLEEAANILEEKIGPGLAVILRSQCARASAALSKYQDGGEGA